MKRKILIIFSVVLAIVISLLVLGQIYIGWQTNENTIDDKVTPSPFSTESVLIKSFSIDNRTAASVYASSQSGQDIVVTQLILKGEDGNSLAVNSINQTLPADGTVTKLTINQSNVDLAFGQTYILTIVTADGNSFTSPPCLPVH